MEMDWDKFRSKGHEFALREELRELIEINGLTKVQAMIFELSGSKLRPTGDASRDRLVRERLGLRV